MFIELTVGDQEIAVNVDSIESFNSHKDEGGSRIHATQGGYYDVDESYKQIQELTKKETDNG